MLSFANHTTVLSKSLLKQLGSCTVRECDQTAPGQYQAYVDEGEDSFDVSLVVDGKGVVQEHLCDCGITSFCKHRAALLVHLAAGSGKKKSGKRKLSKADELLETMEADALRQWVATLLRRHKDLELAFVQQFGTAQQSFTPAEVKALTQQAIRAVIKTRRKADASEVKKIADLWVNLHEPVLNFYLADVAGSEGFEALHTLVEGCLAFHLQAGANTNRIIRYVQQQLQRTAEPVAALHDEGAWQQATSHYLQHLYTPHGDVLTHYLTHIENILAICTAPRRTRLLQALTDTYAQADKVQVYNGAAYTKTVFALVKKYGHFEQFGGVFEPIAYDNEFNTELIGMLIDSGKMELAEQYCRQQVKRNTREVYNLPYLQLLQRISRLRGDEKSLMAVTQTLLPHTFLFEDYLLLNKRVMTVEAKRQWRNQLLLAARAQVYNPRAQSFLLRVLHHEGTISKMLETLNTHTPYSLFLEFFQPMFQTDRRRLLQALLQKDDELGWRMSAQEPEDEDEVFSELAHLMRRHYSDAELDAAFRHNRVNHQRHRGNKFLLYLEEVTSFS